jgi:hypothetical protein
VRLLLLGQGAVLAAPVRASARCWDGQQAVTSANRPGQQSRRSRLRQLLLHKRSTPWSPASAEQRLKLGTRKGKCLSAFAIVGHVRDCRSRTWQLGGLLEGPNRYRVTLMLPSVTRYRSLRQDSAGNVRALHRTARQMVVFAQDEARLLEHNYIGSEHLLLGLLRAEEGVAADVLKDLGITLERVRDVVRIGRLGRSATRLGGGVARGPGGSRPCRARDRRSPPARSGRGRSAARRVALLELQSRFW